MSFSDEKPQHANKRLCMFMIQS